MFLKVLEFDMNTNKVVLEGGSTVHLDSCNGIDSALKGYAEHLAVQCPEIVVIKPIIYISDDVVTQVDNLDAYGLPGVTVEDLGLENIKPLNKEDFKMNIDEVVDGLEQDVKEAIEGVVSVKGGAKFVEKELKEIIAKGGSVIDWLKKNLRLFKYSTTGNGYNKYMALNDSINAKIEKVLTNAKGDKVSLLKKIGNFVLVAILHVLKALLGVVKFAADVVLAIAKYVGCTVISITKGIGVLAVDIVQAFKVDLINAYKKPVLA